MYAYIDMHLRASERSTALLAEAERDRLARQLARVGRSGPALRLLPRLILASSITLLTLAGNVAVAAPADPVWADAPRTLAYRPDTDNCWVTGDLVGDANPAVIHATVCAAR
jgi:hypothetical protein